MKKFISLKDLITVSGEIFINQKERNGSVIWVDEKNQRLKFLSTENQSYYCSFEHVTKINGTSVNE